jgi:hypothetical protein
LIFFTLDNYKLHTADKQLFRNKQKKESSYFLKFESIKKRPKAFIKQLIQ